MSDPVGALLSPFAVRSLSVPNRIVMAPMTRRRSRNGVPGPDVAAYYARRAANDVGLIITEGAAVDHPASANDHDVPRLYGEDAARGWRRVTDSVHEAGGRVIVQLWHVGSVRKPADSPNSQVPSMAPSGLRKPGVAFGAPMSESDIADVIAGFASSAAFAERAGFDGIEIHGAHGYLIDQFLWKELNHRKDAFGADLSGRVRLAAEIVRACRDTLGDEVPIFFRISQWKVQDYAARLVDSPAELELLLGPLVDAGVDVFDCSTRRFWVPEFAGSTLTLAGWVRRLSGRPVVAVGRIGLDADIPPESPGTEAASSLSAVAGMLERGETDLVAVGRALLGDPQWARKVRERRHTEIEPFTAASIEAFV